MSTDIDSSWENERLKEDLSRAKAEHSTLCTQIVELEKDVKHWHDAFNVSEIKFTRKCDELRELRAENARLAALVGQWCYERTEALASLPAASLAEHDAEISILVDRFLRWPLPTSVAADWNATVQGAPHRTGTNLLNAIEAKQMLEYVLDGRRAMIPAKADTVREEDC